MRYSPIQLGDDLYQIKPFTKIMQEGLETVSFQQFYPFFSLFLLLQKQQLRNVLQLLCIALSWLTIDKISGSFYSLSHFLCLFYAFISYLYVNDRPLAVLHHIWPCRSGVSSLILQCSNKAMIAMISSTEYIIIVVYFFFYYHPFFDKSTLFYCVLWK